MKILKTATIMNDLNTEMLITVSLDKAEIFAIREALIEYYQGTSKRILSDVANDKREISSSAYRHHSTICDLKSEFIELAR